MFKQLLAIILGVAIIVTLIVVAFTISQVEREKQNLSVDLEYRSAILAENLQTSVEPLMADVTADRVKRTVERLTDRERLAGLAVYDNKENLLAQSSTLTVDINPAVRIAAEAMDKNQATSEFVKLGDKQMYVLSLPMHQDERVTGALTVLQNADYIDVRISQIWRNNLIRLLLQVFIFAIAIILIVWLIIYRPVVSFAESLRLIRAGKPASWKIAKAPFLFQPLFTEVSKIMRSLSQARTAAREEARLGLEKLDTPWTAERLSEFIKFQMKGRQIFVVSNREPYIHTRAAGDKLKYFVPASGMVTAIEPVMEAAGGMWLAHGSGEADRQAVDAEDKVEVPPDEPKYTLKRIWLTEEEENGYYYGYANEGLWPLCHIAHTRPIFRKEDWEQYRKVNGKFAAALLAEIKKVENPLILIQDYHFSLLPRLIKNSRPDAQIGLFWHIPWPNPESFSICPQRKELLDGMLGADIIGFHTQQHCNNFIDTVGKELEALIDLEQFAITRTSHVTYIKPFPISIAFAGGKDDLGEIRPEEKKELLDSLGVKAEYIGLGVDRLDYTKGILERLGAVEEFLDNNPKYLKKFTFIQIAPPSRDHIPRYREFGQQVREETDRINKKFGSNGWKPVVLLARHHTHEELNRFYRIADFCMVTSLHDGMNLVAKEFVSARTDEQGVLILSQFTGASRELKDAVIVNPYHIEQMGEAIRTALAMSPSEQLKRMKRMRNTVKNYNVYRWSAEFLKAITSLGS